MSGSAHVSSSLLLSTLEQEVTSQRGSVEYGNQDVFFQWIRLAEVLLQAAQPRVSRHEQWNSEYSAHPMMEWCLSKLDRRDKHSSSNQ